MDPRISLYFQKANLEIYFLTRMKNDKYFSINIQKLKTSLNVIGLKLELF
jgi:hypothetical protein